MVHLRKTKLIGEDGSIDTEAWLHHLTSGRRISNLPYVRQAVVLARLAGEEQATPNGESCLHQGLVMAEILNELGVDTDTLMAAIVYSSACYADLSLDDISEHLGPNVTRLIRGTRSMDGIRELFDAVAHHDDSHPRLDKIRKMLLAMVDDVRVVLIKLAERLCVMRHIAPRSDKQKRSFAAETIAIYAPLANRLGIGHIKWELEDLAFRYINSDEYKRISKDLKQRRVDRDRYVEQIVSELDALLKETDIEGTEIYGRAKHIYSIYRKMKRKGVDLDQIYDVTAVRILVPTVEDCYKALSGVHAKWQPIPSEFDDYIATPKPNNYRSIHTAIIGPDKHNVEIQIRTYEMHEEAELGVAAHWMYKEGRKKHTLYEAKIAWLRQVMDWQQEVTRDEKGISEVQQIFDDRVYVFTPQSEIVDLPTGATPLDFAYNVHSEVGHRCRGAKVDGHIVPLTYVLKTGERVEIMTGKQAHPSRDWINPHLGYLKSSRAKAKVHHWLKLQDFEENRAQGHEILDKELARLNLKGADLKAAAERCKFKNEQEMLAALGSGDIKIGTISHAIQALQAPSQPQPTIEEHQIPTTAPKETVTPSDIEIEGIGNLLTHVANCCKPVPGDQIIGYVTQGKGVSIHRQDCGNILHLTTNKQERLLEVKWGEKSSTRYPVDISVQAYDRFGLVRDITNLLTNEKIMILGINSTTDKKENIAHLSLTMEIEGVKPLSRILAKINQLPNVFEVKRQH